MAQANSHNILRYEIKSITINRYNKKQKGKIIWKFISVGWASLRINAMLFINVNHIR